MSLWPTCHIADGDIRITAFWVDHDYVDVTVSDGRITTVTEFVLDASQVSELVAYLSAPPPPED